MGTRAFENFLISIQGHIGASNIGVGILERKVVTLTAMLDGDDPKVALRLEEAQRELGKTQTTIVELIKDQFPDANLHFVDDNN